MLTNLKIGTKLLLRIGVLVVGLLGFMGYAYWNRTTVQVGGPLYAEVVESKDLLADILPPPAFLLEPYLVTAQMLTASPDQLPDLVARGKQLQAEYQARHDYWDKQLEPNAMRDALVVGSYQPALEFFEIRDRDFIPAVLAGDKDKATAIYAGGLRTKFEEHRARIDDTVKLAQAQGQKNEEGAALDIRHSNYVFFAAFAGLLLISVMLGANISGGITKPLAETVAVLEAVADGDLTRHLEKRSSDEMGTLAEAANRAIASMRSAISSIADNAQALAGAAEELAAVSGQMSSNAEDTSGQASIVSAASEQVSRNVETVSTGADEMTASIKEIAKNATEAARVATTAVAAAESTSATMERLGNSSDEIGKVVRVITSIAEQTNLLALNATIEAARAGESGKGFAVVANEVKELAKETAKATEDICQKVAAIQSDTGNAVGAIAEIGSIIGRINDISNSIAGAVEEQSATTNEIGRNVSEAAKGTAEIANNITGVARAAASTNNGANDARQAADELARMATELQSLVGRFKYSADAPRRVGATHEPSSTSWLGDPTSDALAASAA